MRFSTLHIKNFRSVGPNGVTIRFSQATNLISLIGVNGAGKSNIIQALGIVLSVFPFGRFDPTENDFHAKNTDSDLLIELRLAPPIVEHDVYQADFKIVGFRYRAWLKKRGDGKGTITTEHVCIGEDEAALVKPTRIYKKSKGGEKIDNQPRQLSASDHLWRLGDAFYIDAPRLESFFDGTTGYSPLGRLFDVYRDDFRDPTNTIPADNDTEVHREIALKDLGAKLAEILRTPKLVEIEHALTDRLSQFMGVPTRSFQIAMALPSHRELFDKVVELQMVPRKGIPPLPMERLGAGHRAILRLAVIDALLALGKSPQYTLLIEEPEIYLHVHLRRYFSRVLQRLASNGHQVILATHSTRFVNIARATEVVRCTKTPGGATQVHQVSDQFVFDKKATAKISRMANEEMLFANHVIITEGKDDQEIVRLLLAKAGVDVDARGVSIIMADSANSIPDYVTVAGELRIDFYVIHDEDDPVAQEKRNVIIRERVKKYAEAGRPALHTFIPRLEAILGDEKKGALEKTIEKLEALDYAAIQFTFPKLTEPIDEFIVTRNLK